MLTGPDVSSYQSGINFALVKQQGHDVTYIKLGGDNIARYVSDSYAGLVDRARAAGLIVGHYWVTGRHDPEAAANFFCDNLRNVQPGDFFVLDNETLDDGNSYNDDEAARWIRTVQAREGGGPSRLLHYANQAQTNSHGWPETLATGANFIIADYNNSPFNLNVGTIPASRIVGHQYTSSGSAGGISTIDMNAFQDVAFEYSGGFLMALSDQQQQAIYDAIFNGGDSMPDTLPLKDNIQRIYQLLSQPVLRDLNGDGTPDEVSQIQDNADTNTMVRALLTGTTGSGAVPPIDVDALAAAIVAKLPAQSVTVEQIVDAVKALSFSAK